MKKLVNEYAYHGGYMDHWLATGVQQTTVDETPSAQEDLAAFRRRMLASLRQPELPFERPPIEMEAFGATFWEGRICREDHLLDQVCTLSTWQHLARWAYIRVRAGQSAEISARLLAAGPARLWLNGKQVCSGGDLGELGGTQRFAHDLALHFKRGWNTFYLLLEDVSIGPSLLSASLRLEGPGLEDARVEYECQYRYPEQRRGMEALFSITALSQTVYTRDDQIVLHTPARLTGGANVVMRLKTAEGGIYAESFGKVEPGASLQSIFSMQLPAGQLTAQILPQPGLYYDEKLRAERVIPFMNVPYNYYHTPEGTYEDRLVALAQEMARKPGVFGETAKMMLGWWDSITPADIRTACARTPRREAGCLLELLGLAGMAHRLSKSKNFPAELLPDLEAALTGFDYNPAGLAQAQLPGETGQIALLAAQTLAGQKYPKATFGALGLTGTQARKQAETRLRELLRQNGQMGWREGFSQLDLRLVALSHLADLAKDEPIAELAAILLDQTIFSLGPFSYQGALGAPQLQTSAAELKTGRLHPSAGISRLLFGSGAFTPCLNGIFSLAVAKDYQMPALLVQTASDGFEAIWTRERSARPAEGWEACQVAFKTPDFLLSSLQDYRPGQPGGQVHPWQATMGTEAVVFTSHPASLNPFEGYPAGAWCGNASLPRVAQWKDSLICLYNLPKDDLLNFTHAYVPFFAYDDTLYVDGWILLRKGDGYLALRASNGLHLAELGNDANYEVRADGPQTAWLVQMGRKALDGEFSDFCGKVLATPLKCDGLHVEWTTIRDEKLEFDWTGSLLCNGVEVPLTGGKRLESPFTNAEFPAETVDIGFGDQLMRLDFS